jgi:hypothetical protein
MTLCNSAAMLHPQSHEVGGPESWKLSHVLSGHSGWVRALALDPSLTRLVSASGMVISPHFR